MCGIAGILNIKAQTKELRDKALKMAQKIRHRGPDWSGIYVGGSAILAHERLSIVDPQSGGQPLYSPDRCTRTCCARRWTPPWARPTAMPGSRRSTTLCVQSWQSGCGRTTRPAAGSSGAGKGVRRWYWQTGYGLPTPGSCCGPLAA